MARAHLYRRIVDSQGNIVPNTVVTIYENGTTTVLAQTLYTTAAGSGSLPNPLVTSDGFVSFWLGRPQSVRIGLKTQGGNETFLDDVQVSVPPENLVQAQSPLTIINDAVPGWYLQAGNGGQAAWVDAAGLIEAKPSPINLFYSYDVTNGITDDLAFTDAGGSAITPTLVDVTADTKPSGQTFGKAIRLPNTGVCATRVPAKSYAEAGVVIFLYKVVATGSGDPAFLRVIIDDSLITVETPTVADLTNVWLIGYVSDVPTGSHRIMFEQHPGTDTGSYVLLGPIYLQYGNNIPAHTHAGGADASVRLGDGSVANFEGATAVGANAAANGAGASAYGYGATAAQGGTAVGSQAIAGSDAVAIGTPATGQTAVGSWVSIGKNAYAGGDSAVAIGATAQAQGVTNVAIGANAQTGTFADAVAIGSGAKALAQRAVALGAGAQVGAGHDNSIAIGPNVATTAANQARIGDSSTTVVIPGDFRQTGGNGVFGGPGGTLGFYGAAGVAKPAVTGSRGGNATLAALLTALGNLGLITDQSTA